MKYSVETIGAYGGAEGGEKHKIASDIYPLLTQGVIEQSLNCEGMLQTRANNDISGSATFHWFDSVFSCFKDRVKYFRYPFLPSAEAKVSYLYCSLQTPGASETPRGPFTACPKRHFLSSPAGRSANIAAVLFLLVSVHTSLNDSGVPSRYGARRAASETTRGRDAAQTHAQSIPICPTEQVGPLSVFPQRCQAGVSGLRARRKRSDRTPFSLCVGQQHRWHRECHTSLN